MTKKKRKWTPESAREHIIKVRDKYKAYGLTYCSACDYLKIPAIYKNIYKDDE